MPEKKILDAVEEWGKQKTNVFNKDVVGALDKYDAELKPQTNNTLKNNSCCWRMY